MILGPEKFRLPTIDGSKVEFLVNWTEGVDNCNYVKMRIEGKRDILLNRGAFIRAAMFIGTEAEQDSLIPTKSVQIQHVQKKFVLKLLKAMEAGENLEFTASFDVPMNGETLPILTATDHLT